MPSCPNCGQAVSTRAFYRTTGTTHRYECSKAPSCGWATQEYAISTSLLQTIFPNAARMKEAGDEAGDEAGEPGEKWSET